MTGHPAVGDQVNISARTAEERRALRDQFRAVSGRSTRMTRTPPGGSSTRGRTNSPSPAGTTTPAIHDDAPED